MLKREIFLDPAHPENALPALTAGANYAASVIVRNVPEGATAVRMIFSFYGEPTAVKLSGAKIEGETDAWFVAIPEGVLSVEGRAFYEIIVTEGETYWASKGIIEVRKTTVGAQKWEIITLSVDGVKPGDDGDIPLATTPTIQAIQTQMACFALGTDIEAIAAEVAEKANADAVAEKFSSVQQALDEKADKMRLESLEIEVEGKAGQEAINTIESAVEGLEEAVAQKAGADALEEVRALAQSSKNDVATKAESADVEALDTRLMVAEATLSGKASANDVVVLEGRVTTAEAVIATKASADSVALLSGRLTSVQSELATAQSEIDAAQYDITELERDVESLCNMTAGKVEFRAVASLAELMEIPQNERESGIIYLVPNNGAGEGNIKDEYIVIFDSAGEKQFEKIGTTEVSLEGYATTEQVGTEATTRQQEDAAIRSAISAEQTAREQADSAFQSALTTETQARQTQDAALQVTIEMVRGEIPDVSGKADKSEVAEVAADLTAEQTAREHADSALEETLATESTERKTADAQLQRAIEANANAITTEEEARAEADTALANRVTALEQNSGGGGGDVDLSGYATTAYVDEAIAGIDVTGQLAPLEEKANANTAAIEGVKNSLEAVEGEVDEISSSLDEKQPVGNYATKEELQDVNQAIEAGTDYNLSPDNIINGLSYDDYITISPTVATGSACDSATVVMEVERTSAWAQLSTGTDITLAEFSIGSLGTTSFKAREFSSGQGVYAYQSASQSSRSSFGVGKHLFIIRFQKTSATATSQVSSIDNAANLTYNRTGMNGLGIKVGGSSSSYNGLTFKTLIYNRTLTNEEVALFFENGIDAYDVSLEEKTRLTLQKTRETEASLQEQINNIDIPSLDEYATEAWVKNQAPDANGDINHTNLNTRGTTVSDLKYVNEGGTAAAALSAITSEGNMKAQVQQVIENTGGAHISSTTTTTGAKATVKARFINGSTVTQAALDAGDGTAKLVLSDATGTLTITPTTEFGSSSISWGNVTNKPATFPPETHTHTVSEITDLNLPDPVTVDTALSTTSTNPVQNKVVKAAVDSLTSSVASANSTANANMSDIMALDTRVGTAEGKITALEAEATGASIVFEVTNYTEGGTNEDSVLHIYQKVEGGANQQVYVSNNKPLAGQSFDLTTDEGKVAALQALIVAFGGTVSVA